MININGCWFWKDWYWIWGTLGPWSFRILDQLSGCIWLLCGHYMVIIWVLYGYYMAIIWSLYGYYMVIIWLMMVNNHLVGGIPTLWKIWVRQLGWHSQYDGKNEKCSKPPTSNNTIMIYGVCAPGNYYDGFMLVSNKVVCFVSWWW